MSARNSFKHPSDLEYLSESYLGVAIAPFGSGNHIGLLYKLDDTVRLLHLAWHKRLQDHPAEEGERYLWAPFAFELEEQVALAGMASEVAANAQPNDFPYGFDCVFVAGVDMFDKAGNAVLYPVGKGLTCATFLFSLLKWWGYPTVDVKTWHQVAGDVEWQQQIISWLAQSGDPESLAQAEALAKDVGCVRLRPDQMAGSCVIDPASWPIEFDEAQTLALEVMEQVASERAMRPDALGR